MRDAHTCFILPPAHGTGARADSRQSLVQECTCTPYRTYRSVCRVTCVYPTPCLLWPLCVGHQMSVVGRFNTWSAAHGPLTGKVGVLRRARTDTAAAVAVRDLAGFVEAMHIFAIHHCLTVS